MNSLDGGAPMVNAPKGSPIGTIFIGIFVIIGIIIGVIFATRRGSGTPPVYQPPQVAATPPPPATVPIGSSPASSMGREMAVSTVSRTPDEMVNRKQAEAGQTADLYAGSGLSRYEINAQLAQAQRDAGKRVDIPKFR